MKNISSYLQYICCFEEPGHIYLFNGTHKAKLNNYHIIVFIQFPFPFTIAKGVGASGRWNDNLWQNWVKVISDTYHVCARLYRVGFYSEYHQYHYFISSSVIITITTIIVTVVLRNYIDYNDNNVMTIVTFIIR